jgi:hypothetical protein
MTRTAFGASLVAIVLSAGLASAQNPAIGQLPLPGDLYGYSPLVPTIDPFPSRSTGYAPSMFGPNGGKRIYWPQVTSTSPTNVQPNTVTVPAAPSEYPAQPGRLLRRFGR